MQDTKTTDPTTPSVLCDLDYILNSEPIPQSDHMLQHEVQKRVREKSTDTILVSATAVWWVYPIRENGQRSWKLDWEGLSEEFRPDTWTPEVVQEIVRVAKGHRHPGVRVRYLEALWNNHREIGVRRGDIINDIGRAHSEWGAIQVESDSIIYEGIEHLSRARELASLRNNTPEANDIDSIFEKIFSRAVEKTDFITCVLVVRAMDGADRIPRSISEVTSTTWHYDLLTMAGGEISPQDAVRLIDTAYSVCKWVDSSIDAHPYHQTAVSILVKAAREQLASESGNGLLATTFAQNAVARGHQTGFPEAEMRPLHALLRRANHAAVNEMKEIRVEVPISDEMRAQLDRDKEALIELASTDPTAAFIRAALLNLPERSSGTTGLFLVDKLPGFYITGDRSGGSVTPERRAMQELRINVEGVYLPIFAEQLRAILQALGVEQLIGAITGSAAADGTDTAGIETGLYAFAEGRHTEASYVLIPQIEPLLRNLLSKANGRVTRVGNGGQFEVMLGSLVEQVEEGAPTIGYWLRAIISDPDGLNLRNNLLHGILPASQVGYVVAVITIQALLLISTLCITPKPEDQDEGSSALPAESD